MILIFYKNTSMYILLLFLVTFKYYQICQIKSNQINTLLFLNNTRLRIEIK